LSNPRRQRRLILAILAVAGIFLLSGLKVNRSTTVSTLVGAQLEQIVTQIATITSRLAQNPPVFDLPNPVARG
jgi:hypothetical protein